MLAGLVQALFAAAAVAAGVVTLRYHRYRLLAGLVAAAVVASGIVIGIVYLAGGERPRALAAGSGSWSWLITGTQPAHRPGGSPQPPGMLAAGRMAPRSPPATGRPPSPKTPLTELVRLAKIRWRAGHNYRELEHGLGLDHFEGRSHAGWHRHVTLAALAPAFCTMIRTGPKAPAPG